MPKDEEEDEEIVEDEESQPQVEESTNFKKIALEELMTPDVDPTNLEQGARWIRVAQSEEEKPEKTAIYDLDKSIKSREYHSTEAYSAVGSGDYDSQKASTFTDSNQKDQRFNQVNQVNPYETSNEQDLKDRRKKEFW